MMMATQAAIVMTRKKIVRKGPAAPAGCRRPLPCSAHAELEISRHDGDHLSDGEVLQHEELGKLIHEIAGQDQERAPEKERPYPSCAAHREHTSGNL
jgi:hypothetical protein